MSESISITRGLVKLTTLGKKILSKQNRLIINDVSVGEKPPTDFTSFEEFKKQASSSLESIQELINFRANLKSAIVRSNAMTTVKIGKTEMTVAEAIERKNSIELEMNLLKVLKNQFTISTSRRDEMNEQVHRQLERLVDSSFGGKEKVEKDDYDNIAGPFLKINECKLVDPLKVEGVIDDLEEKIEDFLANVDVALSESNARTMIEV